MRNMENMQTPLLGDANVEMLKGTGHDGAQPSATTLQTPNPLLTPAHRGGQDPGATPMTVRGQAPSATPRTDSGATPLRTPFRDNLGLNTEDGGSLVGDTPREMRRAQQTAKMQLQMGLRGLPAPKNDFELVLDKDGDNAREQGQVVAFEEDAAERDERLGRLQADERRRDLARRSQVVQRNLPRPANVDVEAMLAALSSLSPSDDASLRAVRLVEEEMLHLIKHDSVLYPTVGSKQVGGQRHSGLPTIPDDKLERARREIHQEMATTWGFPGATEDTLKRAVIASLDEETPEGQALISSLEIRLKEQRDALVWSVKQQQWTRPDGLSFADLRAGQEARLEAIRQEMARLAGVAAKEEKRLAKVLGGYQARSKALAGDIRGAYTTLQESDVQREAFVRLQAMEQTAVGDRQAALEEEVRVLERRERMAQAEYKERDEARRLLQEQVDALEDALAMREAEVLNEQALAAAV